MWRESWFRLHAGNPARGVAESALASVMAEPTGRSPTAGCAVQAPSGEPSIRSAPPGRRATPRRARDLQSGHGRAPGFHCDEWSADPSWSPAPAFSVPCRI